MKPDFGKLITQKIDARLIAPLMMLVIILFTGHSCIDERISHDPSLRLSFSSDTVLFDTVFTTIGSSTQRMKVYNPNNKNLEISLIGLAKGENSPYRINVNGEQSATNRFTGVELRARDSLFIFVEVTIDPLASDAALLVKDSIIFLTNNHQQDVKLIAFGQDMEVLRNYHITADTTLNANKPYLIYGDLVVDSAKTLTLEAGCELYFHDKASLLVYGNLIADGTLEAPVLMRGDRRDMLYYNPRVPYAYRSNQWGGVLLFNKEGSHRLNHVVMNSGLVGIYFSNEDRNYRPKLEINNSRIHNFLKYGLVVQNGDVVVNNSEISNTGSYSVYLNGGNHRFVHCTIANYFNSSNLRVQPSGKEGNAAVMIMELNRIIPMQTFFGNCVIAGSSSNEFEILSRFDSSYKGLFSNSYIRKEKPEADNLMFKEVVWYNYADSLLFRNTFLDSAKMTYYNFVPDSLSPFRDMADVELAKDFPFDLHGNSRLADGKPDAGAYEWKPSTSED